MKNRIVSERVATTSKTKMIPVFDRWMKKLAEVHQTYIDRDKGQGDSPYYYFERSQTGFLATAIWLLGGTALEEYSTYKIKDEKRFSGRSDLYINQGDVRFECEIKYLDICLNGSVPKYCQRFKDKLDEVIEDVDRLEGREGLAICFGRSSFRNMQPDELRNSLKDWQRALNKKLDYSALYWVGFENPEHSIGEEWKHPGIWIAIKEVKPKKRTPLSEARNSVEFLALAKSQDECSCHTSICSINVVSEVLTHRDHENKYQVDSVSRRKHCFK
ncbi:hypothetical protein GC207_07695 [bacterium]|nr:hypothetical protein [bacterium]